MGLDWIPLRKPKPGSEGEFLSAFGALTSQRNWLPGTPIPFRACDDEDGSDAAHDSLAACTITPQETLGAPRVGRDAAADAWIRDGHATARHKPPTIHAWMRHFEGYWVLELLPDNDTLPIGGNAPLGGPEPFSFRGKLLRDCTDLLGKDLHQAASLNHLPDQLARYGRALMVAATAHARAHRVTEVMGLRALDEAQMKDDTPRNRAMRQVHIVASAARWGLWWSARGHGLNALW